MTQFTSSVLPMIKWAAGGANARLGLYLGSWNVRILNFYQKYIILP